MRRLRVHCLIDTLGIGGAEVLLAELAAVAGDADMSLSVGYLQDKGGGMAAERLRAEGVRPQLVGIGPRLGPDALRRVRRHLRATPADVIHTHLPYADLLGCLAARTLRTPALSTVHASEWGGSRAEDVRVSLAARARRIGAKRVIMVSDAARANYLGRGWDRPERVVTVRNGIAGRAEPEAGRRVRAELGLAPDDLVVSMISSLRPEKGHDSACRAVALLAGSHPNVRLLVAGDGPCREDVARAAAPLGDRAVLAGYRADAMAVLAASDVLLHPSLHEALPTTLMEAGAASVPVVATRVGGIPEVVTHGAGGLLVPSPPDPAALAAALGEVLSSPARRAAMGAAARERFDAEHAAPAWATRLRGVYDSVVGGR